jgi:ketosteroid isomerase-like protein
MKHAPLLAAVAFLAGPGIGFFARSSGLGTHPRTHTRAADLAAIEKLHQEDIAATLSQDPNLLVDVWTEDGVRLEPGRPAVVGKKAIEADNQEGRAVQPEFQVLTYAPEFKEVQIANDWAFEWNTWEAKFKMSPDGPPLSLRAKGLRVLRRQGDGSWKFARVIWNQAEQQ